MPKREPRQYLVDKIQQLRSEPSVHIMNKMSRLTAPIGGPKGIILDIVHIVNITSFAGNSVVLPVTLVHQEGGSFYRKQKCSA